MTSRNPTPKELFLTNKKAVQAHDNIFSLEPVRHSLDTALLQYQRQLLDIPPNPATFERIRGAQEFISILMNLTLTPQPVKKSDSDNLIHSK